MDYKVVEEREENGLIYQKVRYYEGDVTTEDEPDLSNPDGPIIPVTRYRRTAMVEEREYWYEQIPS